MARAFPEPCRDNTGGRAEVTANIVFFEDDSPGITRKRTRHGAWAYYGADGKRITDRDVIDRLNAVGLPPAYTDAWFCPDPDGHIQAVGWDEKGRSNIATTSASARSRRRPNTICAHRSATR